MMTGGTSASPPLYARTRRATGRQETSVPVGGVGVKGLANWVLGQGRPGRQPVLHVARQQMVELAAPGQPMPQIHRHDGAYDLLKTLARQALDLSDAHGLLLGALQPHLHAFAPDVEAGSVDQPWHLPALGIPRRFSTADALWRNTVDTVANDASLPASLTAFALHRWAARATGQQDGSSVHSLFVNLSVSHEHQATLSPTPHSGQGENNQFFLDQLLASYEQDSERPAQKVQSAPDRGGAGLGENMAAGSSRTGLLGTPALADRSPSPQARADRRRPSRHRPLSPSRCSPLCVARPTAHRMRHP
jgi:hypothetical protein